MEVKVIHQVLSDLFINITAGWLGAIFIAPAISNKSWADKLFNLTMNGIFATLSLEVAFILRIL